MNELIQKITAPNGGVFTGQGTNTYLIGKKDITLVDPGPNISEHIEAILKAGSGKIKRKHAFKSHILTKKSKKRKLKLTHSGLVHKSDSQNIKEQLRMV